ncbi:MAG TPA: methyltransferase domain-containing protein [Thermoanaerobaculia bacterium]|jgi:SAM-dependent methyltransferase
MGTGVGLGVDHPHTTLARRDLIKSKPFLHKVYGDWYGRIVAALPPGDGRVLELGSGGGFFRERFPSLLSSEIVAWQGVSLVADAHALPFAAERLRAIVMTNVFHHLPNARGFLREAARAVHGGGTIVMVEPWVTAWSRLVYRHLHEEAFEPDASEWEFPSSGPVSGANNALPWMMFARDRARFEREFPEWSIERIVPFMPVAYLISGGMSYPGLMPGFTYGLWRGLEAAAAPIMGRVAMFALIVLRRTLL